MFPEALSLQVRLARIRGPPPQWRSPPRPATQHQDMPAAQAYQQVRLGIGRGLGMAADLVVETGVDQKALIGMRPPEQAELKQRQRLEDQRIGGARRYRFAEYG